MAAKNKLKTNRAAAKRFKISASGKVMHRRAGKSHLLLRKSKKRKRRLRKFAPLSEADMNNIRHLLKR